MCYRNQDTLFGNLKYSNEVNFQFFNATMKYIFSKRSANISKNFDLYLGRGKLYHSFLSSLGMY